MPPLAPVTSITLPCIEASDLTGYPIPAHLKGYDRPLNREAEFVRLRRDSQGAFFFPSCGGSARKMTKLADLKSAGQPAVQILYKRSPERTKTPQNALLQPLSHNNIRKTGSIRNRQVTSSTLVVGSILPFPRKPNPPNSSSKRPARGGRRRCRSLRPREVLSSKSPALKRRIRRALGLVSCWRTSGILPFANHRPALRTRAGIPCRRIRKSAFVNSRNSASL